VKFQASAWVQCLIVHIPLKLFCSSTNFITFQLNVVLIVPENASQIFLEKIV